ncbi:MAG: matrixin family metalloprotease [Isosphaeraceae bacterium]|nr:matrixin family metalloprotease [Isosphaeraceae bacterium]
MFGSFKRSRDTVRPLRARSARPLVEGLEDRFLLYAATGDVWTYPIRVTYSFMPDGTSIGGVSSNLFSTLNAYSSTATWEGLFAKAAASWENVANVNLVQVSDDGSPSDSGSYQQGAPNFGDIRIGAMPLAGGLLAETFMPPQANGGSDAGDIILNSNVNWSPSTGYDLLTVALHELGHTMSLGESSVTTAVMYQYYEGVRQTLTSDDIAGVDSAFGARVAGTNTSYTTATPVTFNGADQAVVTGVQVASATNQNWYSVVVPSGTSGTLSVTMQSSNLSSLEPRLTLYNSALQGLAQASATTYGGTVTVTLTGVTAGQTYYVRATANTSGVGSAGAYGLNVNAGTGTMAAIAPPNTAVTIQLDQSAGMQNMNTKGSLSHPVGLVPVDYVEHGHTSARGHKLAPSGRALHHADR